MIDAAFIEEIKYRNPIEDVISSYVKLQKGGSNLVGLCPFHSEKTGSFTVFPNSRNFYCFGCNAGGDVITFIMKAENLDYPSAVEFLAKRAGLQMPDDNEKRPGDGITKERLWQMNKDAARFFYDCFEKNENAKTYFYNKRQLSVQTVRRFGLGYAPDGFGALTDHMHKLGYNDAELVAGFLCGISEKTGRTYDKFRNRVMFPIIDVYGNIIAFGGRVLDDSLPKYLNSSDTRIFKKSRNLFALNYAKNNCSECFILCEGYMDVIALHEAGFTNAVATLGTALTPDQARIMKRYTDKVIISYDGDEAGQRAANRAFQLLSEAGLQTRILQYEGAKDPDEYIKKFGADKFRQVLNGSRTEFEYKLEKILKEHDISSAEGKIKAAEEACKFISGVSSAVERDVYLVKSAEALSIPKESLALDVRRLIKKRQATEKRGETKRLINVMERSAGEVRHSPASAANMKALRAEQAILGMLILYPELYTDLLRKGESLEASDFVTDFNKKVAEALIPPIKEGTPFDHGMLGEIFDEESMGRITRMIIDREKLGNNDIGVFYDCVLALKKEKHSRVSSIEDILNMQRNKLNK
ncbi:MAG: DNA primase [Ruminococcaceae bacterium]|nr:DNA primase [Oscillospiraceae bacterium]